MSFLNAEQQQAVDARDGQWAVLAGPGSGKTTTLIARYKALVESGVPKTDIICVTFTKEAADSMMKRASGARDQFCTFHSLGYRICRMENGEQPVEPELRHRLLCNLSRKWGLEYKVIESFISKCRRAGMTPEQALAAEDSKYGASRAYSDYETERLKGGWIDFDSMLCDAAKLLEDPEVAARWQFKYPLADEMQDSDNLQWRMMQLMSQRHGNVMVVGDPNQCQPAGTKILTLVSRAHGSIPAKFKEVNIENLRNGDEVLSWSRKEDRIFHAPRKIKVASRPYDGSMLMVSSNGNETQVTPNHFVWTKFSPEVFQQEPHYVYLMWRADRGFRIGVSYVRRKGQSNQIGHRGYQEKAEKFWILCMAPNRQEAETLEEIYSLRYGIPQTVFHRYNGVKASNEQLIRIFNSVSPQGGFQCLQDHGRLFEHPLLTRPHKGRQPLHGYFKTAAANLMVDWMSLPTRRQYRSAKIDSITSSNHSRLVYSLDVEKDHTYVADGIPVGNSIYAWRDAHPENLTSFTAWFPKGQYLYLGRNYRSSHTIVGYVRKKAPVNTPLNEKMVPAGLELGEPIEYRKFLSEADEAESAIVAAQRNPVQSAILARTNRGLAPVENFCIEHGVRYQLLGRSGFWKQGEITKAVEKLKGHIGSSLPTAIALVWNALEKHYLVDDRTKEDNDAWENLLVLRDIAKKFTDVGTFVAYANRCAHAKRQPSGITLGTIHSAKGLEWEHVYVIGVRESMMPHSKSLDMAEERRIFFVSISRPAATLRLSWTGAASPFIRPDLTNEKMAELETNTKNVERWTKSPESGK